MHIYYKDGAEQSLYFEDKVSDQCIRIADELREYLDENDADAAFTVFVNDNGSTHYLDWTDSPYTPTTALILSSCVDDPYALTDPDDLCDAVEEAIDEWLAEFC